MATNLTGGRWAKKQAGSESIYNTPKLDLFLELGTESLRGT